MTTKIIEQTMVEEVERRLAGKYADVPAERISGVIDGTVEITSHGPRDMPIRGMRYSVDAASVLLLVEYPSRIQQKSSSREPDTMHPCNPPQAKRY